MGYRKVPVIYTLDVDKYEGLTVRMKGVSIGRMRRMVHLVDSDDESTLTFVDEMIDLIAYGLVSWTLEEEDGTPVEPCRAEVEELDFETLTAILQAWLNRITGVDDDLGKGSPDGEKSPVQLPTMELL